MRVGAFFMKRITSRKSRLALVALVSLAVLVAAGCGSGGGSVPSGTVAVVDGQKISHSALDEQLAQAKLVYKQNKRDFPQPGTSQYQALQQQMTANLVRIAEIEQQAKAYKLSATDAEIDQRVDQLVKRYFKGDKAKYTTALKQQVGTTPDGYRPVVRTQILYEKLVVAITKDIKVTDAEVKAYYDKNKGSAPYTTPESRKMRHILVKTLAEADKLYAQLKAGADFATLEKKSSLDTGTNNQGGILTVTKGQTVPEYETVAFKLVTGTISKPVHSKQYCYFIIKPVSDLTPATTQPFSKAANGIRTTLLGKKKNDALTAWSTALSKKYASKVKYASGFAPPAAATTPSTTTG